MPACPDPKSRPCRLRHRRHALESPQEARKRPERARRAIWPWFALGAALPVAWLALETVCARPERQVAVNQESTETAPAVVDTSESGTLASVSGRPVPAKPPEWQKTRCDKESGETSINGGCFLELAKKPPCHASHFEHGGKCFAAVAKPRRPDTSLEE